jgi:hypothetical protein
LGLINKSCLPPSLPIKKKRKNENGQKETRTKKSIVMGRVLEFRACIKYSMKYWKFFYKIKCEFYRDNKNIYPMILCDL